MNHNDGVLKCETIKNIISPICPVNKNISKWDAFDLKLKVKRMLPNLEGCKTFEDFQKIVNSSYLLEGLDNVKINDDEANKFATETWKEKMNDGNMSKSDSLVTFKEHL